ncbi:hypothetical protein [Sinomonas atrocyanea]|uniref:hypothetical protein n=1 Tax=Sinomonas atrocyanea TaxID=37927 RepID=UPI0027834AD0|nr:hypothetical protein [Sinomonas atrocyanea]MDQ0259938.1 cobalamin biosynthesis protein CobT [Sinomonas atrocyanea]MDR6619959.1 cobalamin biosynthesis protein CobT [Sinomonas atrocyanea]
MDAENPNASSPSADRAPQEGGYGSPAPEEEVPQGAPAGGAAPQGSATNEQEQDTAVRDAQDQGGSESREQPQADLAEPEEAPSTDADLDEGNTEDHGHRESFSSESDEDGSGLPEGGEHA